MKIRKLKLLRYCIFLCHINGDINVVSQFSLYLRILYWRYHRFVGGSKSSCNNRALVTPWRFVNGQGLLPTCEVCCIVAAGDTHRIIVSCGPATMASTACFCATLTEISRRFPDSLFIVPQLILCCSIFNLTSCIPEHMFWGSYPTTTRFRNHAFYLPIMSFSRVFSTLYSLKTCLLEQW